MARARHVCALDEVVTALDAATASLPEDAITEEVGHLVIDGDPPGTALKPEAKSSSSKGGGGSDSDDAAIAAPPAPQHEAGP